MTRLISRLKEPSTYAGLSGLAVVAGVSTDSFNEYVAAVAGVCAFASIILKEIGSET